MPKLKSRRGVRKRFKITATGKVMIKRPGMRHNLFCKSHGRKRNMRKLVELRVKPEARSIRRLFGKP